MIRTLIVDDNLDFSRSLSQHLNNCPDFDLLDVINNGRDAIDQIAHHQPDILLLDMVMPHIDGLGVLEKAKNLSPATKIIIISALPIENVLSQISARGACYFMAKPVDFDLLSERIREIHALDYSAQTAENPTIAFSPAQEASAPQHRVEKFLYDLGITSRLRGFFFIRDALVNSLSNPSLIHNLTGILYPSLGKTYGTSSKTIERAIRQAITHCWSHGNPEQIANIFGATPKGLLNRPSNGNFIATLLRRLALRE